MTCFIHVVQFWTYLVSWKGYTADHNSWVDENDAGYVHRRVYVAMQ
jgi:hypothetical protein